MKGESVSAFSAKCSIPNSTMTGFIKGKGQPTVGILDKIAKSCDAVPGWLISGTRSPFDKNKDRKLLNDIFEKDPEVIEIDKESGTPVVKTYDDCDSQLQFYCIHCRQWHYHGRGPEGTPYTLGRGEFAGDRSAHCITKNSPFKETGVILDVVGKYDKKKNNKKDEHALMCPECHSYYSAAFNGCICGYINKERDSDYPEIEKIYLEDGGAIITDTGSIKTKQNKIIPSKIAAHIELGNKETLEEKLVRTYGKNSVIKSVGIAYQPETENPDGEVSEEEIVNQTLAVIRSKTIYKSALLSNVRAFYQGVKREEEMVGINERINQMQKAMDTDRQEMKIQNLRIEELLLSLGANAKKRDEQANS